MKNLNWGNHAIYLGLIISSLIRGRSIVTERTFVRRLNHLGFVGSAYFSLVRTRRPGRPPAPRIEQTAWFDRPLRPTERLFVDWSSWDRIDWAIRRHHARLRSGRSNGHRQRAANASWSACGSSFLTNGQVYSGSYRLLRVILEGRRVRSVADRALGLSKSLDFRKRVEII